MACSLAFFVLCVSFFFFLFSFLMYTAVMECTVLLLTLHDRSSATDPSNIGFQEQVLDLMV